MPNPSATYLREYQPPTYFIDTVHLHFTLAEDYSTVQSRLHLRRHPDWPADTALELDGEALELRTLQLDGQALTTDHYRVEKERLVIHKLPETCILEIETRIDPRNNTALEGLYRSGNMFCSQCEAEGFRKITYFVDRPDNMSRFTTTITADKARYPILLSNGNPVAKGDGENGQHWVRWVDPFPKPSYLFALVAGDLACQTDHYTTTSGRAVDLRLYVEHHNQDRCTHALTSLKKAMKWDEDTYGREYDLAIYMIVAVDDFNMGAMENKGLNIFNSKYVLAKQATASDADFQNIESVIGHEYFHNWTGNRITCRDWFQLSLKEGLTVFRDQEFSADMGSRGVKRISDVRSLRTAQFREDAGPMAHPVRPESYIEINNFYTATVYNKGAEVVRMFHTLLGQQAFRKGMDLYFQRHDGQAVTTEDFLQALQDGGTLDLSDFQHWYAQAGTPILAIEGQYNPEQQSYCLTVRQSCPATPGQAHKPAFRIPLAVGLLNSKGQDLPLRLHGEPQSSVANTRMLDLSKTEQRFTFADIPEAPIPSLLRNFSAPVTVHFDYSDTQLAFLLAHDSDDFNRWEAGQQLALRELLKLVQAYQDKQTLHTGKALIQGLQRTLLEQSERDPALCAEILSLPSEIFLGEQMPTIAVEAIHAARRFTSKAIAQQLQSHWHEIYQRHADTGDYQIDAAAIGRRRLKNLSLHYLLELDTAETRQTALQQFLNANNMNDSLAALVALNHLDCPEREEAVDTFYTRWQHDSLVLDKWFAVQACCRLPNTLHKVRELLSHPAFKRENPNKVYALIGSFCSNNPIRFHASNGEGYHFLVDQILYLDKLNPQLAARLVTPLTQWRRHTQTRQQQIRSGLERIVQTGGLSRDTYEIVIKSLADLH